MITSKQFAQPLAIRGDLLLYQSSVDIEEVISGARRQCMIGAGLAVCGFAGILASVASTVPPTAFAVLLAGATANSYALAVVAQRVVRGLAARHVERIVILSTPEDGDTSEVPTAAASHHGSLMQTIAGAATSEEQLAATLELRLAVRTAVVDRWLTLVDPESEAASGLASDADGHDGRASFGDVCGTLRLLHVDADTGVCPDLALLSAILASPKVAVDERVEARSDVIEGIRLTRQLGPMISEVTRADLEQASTGPSEIPPATSIERLGRRAFHGGGAALAAGSLFVLGESCRDSDGVARWKNLPFA